MSLINAIRHQLGLSATPANNFTLDASADNGTMKLARGNAGATTQDILTISNTGKVDFPQQERLNAPVGYVELPSGVIIQWGLATVSTSDNIGSCTSVLPLPKVFPNACVSAVGNTIDGWDASGILICAIPYSTSQLLFGAYRPASPTQVNIYWQAIGY